MSALDADDDTTAWVVGQQVVVYGPYDRRATHMAKVEKVYKTGHVVIGGMRYRPSGNYAHETGSGWSRGHVRIATAELAAEVAGTIKLRRIQEAAEVLKRINDPDRVPDDVLARVLALKEVN